MPSQAAKVIYWNHTKVYVECPACGRKHVHQFEGYETVGPGGRATDILWCDRKEAPLLHRMYYLQYPSSWWIDKENGCYVRASYRGPRPRDEECAEHKIQGPFRNIILPSPFPSAAQPSRPKKHKNRVPNGAALDYSLVRHGSSVIVHGPVQLLEIDQDNREVAILLRPKSYELLYAKDGPRESDDHCYISGVEWAKRARLIAQMVGLTLLSPSRDDALAEGFAGHPEKQLIAGFLSMHTWDDIPGSQKVEQLKKDEAQLLKRYEAAIARPSDDETRGESVDFLRGEIRAVKKTINTLEGIVKELQTLYTDKHIAFLEKMRDIEPPGRLTTATILISSVDDDPCEDCELFIEKVNAFFGVEISAVERTWPPVEPSFESVEHVSSSSTSARFGSSAPAPRPYVQVPVSTPDPVQPQRQIQKRREMPGAYRNLQATVETDDEDELEWGALPNGRR